MIQDKDEKLINDTEWADLMAEAYEAARCPVDELGKKRVWERIKKQMESGRRTRRLEWMALASGLIVVLGITKVLEPRDDVREKGTFATIPVVVTPYVLDQDGSTEPLGPDAPPGLTIVFHAHASQVGHYAMVMAEGKGPPFVAIDEGGRIGPEDQILTKNGSIFGLKTEPNKFFKMCVLAATDPSVLADHLKDLGQTWAQLPAANCVSIESPGR